MPGPLSLTRLVDFTSEEKRVITFAPLSFMQNKHKFIDLWPIKAQVSVLLYLSKFARWAEKRIGAQDLEIILWFTRFGWTFCSVVHFIRMYARQSKVKLVRINHCGLFEGWDFAKIRLYTQLKEFNLVYRTQHFVITQM